MPHHVLQVLALTLLLGACGRPDPLSDPGVGSPLATLDELASTETEPAGDVPAADLDRMSSNARLRWGTTGSGGLRLTFHNHLEQEVEDVRVRLVICSEEGEVLSDRTYEWPSPVDAVADSSHLNLPAQRVPEGNETLTWAIVGATRR